MSYTGNFAKNVNNYGKKLFQQFNNLENYTDHKLNILHNSNYYIAPILFCLLILYASLAAPKLPKAVLSMFDNILFKFLFIALLIFTTIHKPFLSIIISLAILVSIQMLSYYESSDKMINIIHKTQHTKNTNVHNTNIPNSNLSIPISNDDAISGVNDHMFLSVVDNDEEKDKEISKCGMPDTPPLSNPNTQEIIGYTDPDYALY